MRTEQLCTAVRAVLAHAAEGRPEVICVDGRAGTGKTTLLREFTNQARAEGFAVLTGEGAADEAGFAYGVTARLFEGSEFGVSEPPLDGLRCCGDLSSCPHRPPLPEERVLRGLHRAVRKLSERVPVLITVDNVEHVDVETSRWLTYLRRRIASTRIVLVLAGTGLPMRGELVEGSRWITLSCLTSDESAELVLASFPGASPDFVASCHDLTSGNPALLEVLLRSMSTPDLPRELPAAVRAEVLAMIGRAGDGAVALAQAIAVLGTPSLALAVSFGGDLVVDALQRMGLCTVTESVDFTYPIVREAVASSVSAVERAVLRGRAAAFLHQVDAPNPVIAEQLVSTVPTGAAWVPRVLAAAAAESAPVDAARYLRRLLAEPLRDAARGEVMVALGETLSHTDQPAALVCLRKAGESGLDPSTGRRFVLAFAHELAESGSEDQALRELRAWSSSGDKDIEIFTAALELENNGQVADLGVLGSGGSARHKRFAAALAAFQATSRAEMLGCVRTIHLPTLAKESGTNVLDRRAFRYVVEALVSADEFELAERCCGYALKDPIPVLEELALGLRAWICARRGVLREAEGLGRAVVRRLPDRIECGQAAFAVAALVETWIAMGETEAAVELLRDRNLDGELPESPRWRNLLHQRGRLSAISGDYEAALRDQLECGRWETRNKVMYPWRTQAAEALSALGRKDEALALVAEEIEVTHRWNAATAFGVAVRTAGGMIGGTDGAALLVGAAEVLRDSPARLELATTLLEGGKSTVAMGNPAEARSVLRRAHELSKMCGAVPLMRQAAQTLRIAGGRASRGAADSTGLTQQELVVARRATAGLTNRRIAEELFVSSRAVEQHLTKVYRKLGISGRRHLEAALAGG